MPKMDSKVGRALWIKFKDDSFKIMKLSKAASIHIEIGMLHLDELKNDIWRLIFSDKIADNFNKVMSLNIA